MNVIAKLIAGRPLITCLVIGVVIMSMWWLKFQKKLNMKWYWAPIFSVLHIFLGLATAKLMALIEIGFVVERAVNLRLFGPVFLMPPMYYLGAKITKRNAITILDISTICIAIGLFFGRCNCLISGCCQGTLIGINETLRWPLREIELVYYFIFILCFWQRIYKGKTKGMAYPLFVLIYGIFRFIAEWVREEYTGGIWIFHMAHIWSMLAIIGSSIAIYFIKRNKNGKNRVDN